MTLQSTLPESKQPPALNWLVVTMGDQALNTFGLAKKLCQSKSAQPQLLLFTHLSSWMKFIDEGQLPFVVIIYPSSWWSVLER